MYSGFAPWFMALYLITVISLIVIVLSENRNPLKALAWILVIGFVPFVGILIYILFGQNQRRRHIISKRIYRRISLKPKIASEVWTDSYQYDTARWKGLQDLIKNNADGTVLPADRMEIYHRGAAFFDALKKDLTTARKHIHIESYIFEESLILEELISILEERTTQGVKVRIIYDHVGSWGVRNRLWARLRKQGIQVYPFMPVAFPVFANTVNYRNHRKIIVVDGKVAYTGGMNIAERYRSGLKNNVHWNDCHFRLTGPAVAGVQSVFLLDWYVVSRRVINIDSSFSNEWVPMRHNPDGIKIQFIPGGPIDVWRTIDQVFTAAILRAEKFIYIQTPYFLPTETLENALVTAALSGVEVWIMLPEKSDSWLTGFASESYYDNLLNAGVHIVLYRSGFLHSKLMMIDGEVSTIGSANMDFRSLEHNFEFSAVIYDSRITNRLGHDFHKDLSLCHEITLAEWQSRPRIRRFKCSLVRIFSPLL